MTAIIVLFVAGVLLLAIEVFVPGAVLGILGGLALLAGVVVAFALHGTTGGLLALGAGGLLLGVTLYLEFIVLPRSRLARSLTMNTTVDSTSQPALADPDHVVGQIAETDTTLAPSGYVRLHGKRFEAFSNSGYLPKGVAVRVAGLDNFRLIVTKENHQS